MQQKTRSKSGIFFSGLLVGILVSAVAAVAVAAYAIRHPQRVMRKGAEVVVRQVVQQTMQSLPREVIEQRQDAISESARRFIEAFSANRISDEEMQTLALTGLDMMDDRQITADEIDRFLKLMNQVVS